MVKLIKVPLTPLDPMFRERPRAYTPGSLQKSPKPNTPSQNATTGQVKGQDPPGVGKHEIPKR